MATTAAKTIVSIVGVVWGVGVIFYGISAIAGSGANVAGGTVLMLIGAAVTFLCVRGLVRQHRGGPDGAAV